MGPKPHKNSEHDHERSRVCPVCNGTGIDPDSHFRFTSGGKDDRSCPKCFGECLVSLRDDFGQLKRLKYRDDELWHISHLILVDEQTHEKLAEWHRQFPRLDPKYGPLPGKLEIRVLKDSERHAEIVELMNGPLPQARND